MDPIFYYQTYPVVALLTIMIGFIGFGLIYYYGDYVIKKMQQVIIYFFVAEKIQLEGVVVKLNKADIPLTSDPNDLSLHLCKVTIWRILENEYYTFDISYDPMYKKIQENLLDLDQHIKIPCRRYGYCGDQLFPVWKNVEIGLPYLK